MADLFASDLVNYERCDLPPLVAGERVRCISTMFAWQNTESRHSAVTPR